MNISNNSYVFKRDFTNLENPFVPKKIPKLKDDTGGIHNIFYLHKEHSKLSSTSADTDSIINLDDHYNTNPFLIHDNIFKDIKTGKILSDNREKKENIKENMNIINKPLFLQNTDNFSFVVKKEEGCKHISKNVNKNIKHKKEDDININKYDIKKNITKNESNKNNIFVKLKENNKDKSSDNKKILDKETMIKDKSVKKKKNFHFTKLFKEPNEDNLSNNINNMSNLFEIKGKRYKNKRKESNDNNKTKIKNSIEIINKGNTKMKKNSKFSVIEKGKENSGSVNGEECRANILKENDIQNENDEIRNQNSLDTVDPIKEEIDFIRKNYDLHIIDNIEYYRFLMKEEDVNEYDPEEFLDYSDIDNGLRKEKIYYLLDPKKPMENLEIMEYTIPEKYIKEKKNKYIIYDKEVLK